MKAEISIEYVLEFCVDEALCETLNIELPDNFLLKTVEINAEKSSLSHLCSCSVKMDGETAYSGPIGKDGFMMEVDTVMPIYELQITTDCGSLSDWLNSIEPCIVTVTGSFEGFEDDEVSLSSAMIEKWT